MKRRGGGGGDVFQKGIQASSVIDETCFFLFLFLYVSFSS